jgi:hypothetical protein
VEEGQKADVGGHVADARIGLEHADEPHEDPKQENPVASVINKKVSKM